MRIATGIRLSTALTTALACLCLGYAEQAFIPSIFWLVIPTLALLGVALRVEGRWALSARGANVLGILLSALTLAWFALQILSDSEARFYPMFWASMLVPHLGPLLMLLVLVKSFRPKQLRDHRVLQGVALVEVCLACILATGPLLGLLLPAYLFVALWGFGLLHLGQLGSFAPAEESAGKSPLIAWRWYGLGRALRWTSLVGVAGTLLFIVTPRFGRGDWNPLHLMFTSAMVPRLPTATGTSGEIDLNRTGAIDVDDEIALTVFASEDADAKVPKTDLGGEQRWRGTILDRYGRGRWQSRSFLRTLGAERFLDPVAGLVEKNPAIAPGNDPPFELFDVGPRQFYVTFRFQPRDAGGLFLAEPVVLPEGFRRVPLSFLEGPAGLFYASRSQATIVPVQRATALRGEVAYRQATIPLEEGKVYPANEITPDYVGDLASHAVVGLRDWTFDLVRKLADEGHVSLEPADRDIILSGLELPQARQTSVSRALCDYFVHSGEFSYSLERPRQDTTIDPTLDFLINVREGHCERFATALALVLRSVRIPARVIKGYRGADSRGDGYYDIRHSHAHAWVEALVWERATDGSWYRGWLSLDPTPSNQAASAQEFSLARWWRDSRHVVESIWTDFIVNLDPERQNDLMYDLRTRLARRYRGFLFILGFVGLGVAATLWARHRRAKAMGSRRGLDAYYARLLRLLDRHLGLRPKPAQTPREFGEAARQLLARTLRPFADLPARVVARFYLARYGGQELTGDEWRRVEGELDRFAAALRGDEVVRA